MYWGISFGSSVTPPYPHLPRSQPELAILKKRTIRTANFLDIIRQYFLKMCPGGDLNSHAVRHMVLSHACLPIPAPGRAVIQYQIFSLVPTDRTRSNRHFAYRASWYKIFLRSCRIDSGKAVGKCVNCSSLLPLLSSSVKSLFLRRSSSCLQKSRYTL